MTQESLQNASRRTVLMGAAAATATLAASNAFASSDDHKHHHHAMNPHGDLINAALDCVKKGTACSDHCIKLVKQKDTSIADCLAAVNDMLPMCETLSKLATSQSDHLKDFAKVCIAVCEDCEKECKAHEDKHVECRECMKSCAHCIKECKKLVA